MRKKTACQLFITMSLSLIISGCTQSLEKGWSKDNEGKQAEAIKYFSRALIDVNDTYREKAAQELVRVGNPAVPALTAILLKRGRYHDIHYYGARKEAAWALGEIGAKETAEALLKTLKTIRDSYQEEELIREVRNLNSRANIAAAVRDLSTQLGNREEKAVIAKEVKEQVKVIEDIVKAVLDKDDNVFYNEQELVSVIHQVKSFPAKGKEREKVREEVVQIISKRLKKKRNSGPYELLASVEALGKVGIGNQQVKDMLLEMLEETYTRSAAAFALVRLDDKAILHHLEKVCDKEENIFIKTNLALALYMLGDKSKWDFLASRVNDGSSSQRKETVRLLAMVNDGKASNLLIEALNDKSTEVRLEAVRALKQLGGKATEEALLQVLLNDKDFQVREEAVHSLGKSEVAKSQFKEILADKEENMAVRLATAHHLGKWSDESGFSLSITVIEDNRDKDLSCAALLESISNKKSRQIAETVFSKKSFLFRIPRTYNDKMIIEAIDKIGRAQKKETRTALRKLFRKTVNIYSSKSRMRIIDKSGLHKEDLRLLLRAADLIKNSPAINLEKLRETLEIRKNNKDQLLFIKTSLEKLNSQPAIKLLLEKLLDFKETFTLEEKVKAIAALSRMKEGKEKLREIYQDPGENYLLRFEARKILKEKGEI